MRARIAGWVGVDPADWLVRNYLTVLGVVVIAVSIAGALIDS